MCIILASLTTAPIQNLAIQGVLVVVKALKRNPTL